MIHKATYVTLFLLMLSMLLLYVVRVHSLQLQNHEQRILWSASENYVAESMAAGLLRGLVADFRVLDVFAIYYQAQRSGRDEDLAYLKPYLNRAQYLDPKFVDVYRLASSLLAYDAKQPRAAIALLGKGSQQLPENWEFPFMAGFIAHDSLGDDKLAFELMSQVAGRKDTPAMVMTLAARLLESTSTKADAIIFLQGLLQLIPEDYQQGIKKRIQQYRDGTVPRQDIGAE